MNRCPLVGIDSYVCLAQPGLKLCFYYFLLLVCSPIYPIFLVFIGSFDDLAGLFANLIPTVLCEGVVDHFPKSLIYNICAVAYSTLGCTHTAETKAAISAAKLGTTHTAESKALMSGRKLGNTNGLGNTNASRSPIFVYEHDSRKLAGEYT